MTVLTVGVGMQFTTIAAAVKAAAAGDTVAVNAGLYVNDWVYVNKPLSLVAVGGMVRMQATVQPPNQKAMLITGVSGTTMTINISGFEVWGVRVGDQNGAAVRYEGGNLNLKDVYFHDNQEGLLANPQALGNISIDHSEFDHNGSNGYSHNIYVNKLASFTLKNSYVHDAIVGHEVKSRADSNFITGNRIQNNGGSGSYNVDLPNAGNAQITGNTIQQGANSENVFIIAYGEEGASNLGRQVSIAGNTIVNDMASSKGVLNKSTSSLPYTNNKEFAVGIDSGPLAESGTIQLASRPFVDTAKMQFVISGTVTPPPPAPTMTLAEYHADVTKDFFAWMPKVSSAVFSAAIPIYMKEVTSTTVLGIIPGDVWSV